MSAPVPAATRSAHVALLADGAYEPAMRGLADHAWRRLLCSVFIVDITPEIRQEFRVDELLLRLAAAAWRGVDVRLLIGGARDNIAIAESAAAARERASRLGVAARWLTSHPVRGSHCKLVIADDRVLTGSHNWSPGALSGRSQTQDSVLVDSSDLAALLAARFEDQWQRAEAADAAI
jgi:phosphatidylserine/phosphatidylglycerophosphate/cardiolipin synthase-like enzyme